MEKILLSSEADDVKVSKLLSLCPILRRADFAQPESLQAPLFIDVIELLRVLTGSPDLCEQYSFDTGRKNGHTSKTMRRSPGWFQMGKKSGHPLSTSLVMAQIHVYAAASEIGVDLAHSIIEKLSAIIEGLNDIERAYRATGKHNSKVVLADEQRRAAAAAATSLVEQEALPTSPP